MQINNYKRNLNVNKNNLTMHKYLYSILGDYDNLQNMPWFYIIHNIYIFDNNKYKQLKVTKPRKNINLPYGLKMFD